jgi:hypothetical protein
LKTRKVAAGVWVPRTQNLTLVTFLSYRYGHGRYRITGCDNGRMSVLPSGTPHSYRAGHERICQREMDVSFSSLIPTALSVPDRASALTGAGRERMLSRFQLDRMVDETLAVYREVRLP